MATDTNETIPATVAAPDDAAPGDAALQDAGSGSAQRRVLTVLVAAQICTAAAVTIGFSVAGLIAADLAGNEGAAGLA
nr:hypothetical protein [Micromonospora sp. DSM 115978]